MSDKTQHSQCRGVQRVFSRAARRSHGRVGGGQPALCHAEGVTALQLSGTPHPVPRTEDAITEPRRSTAASQHSNRTALQRAAAASPHRALGIHGYPTLTLACGELPQPLHAARRAARARQARGEQERAPLHAGRAPRPSCRAHGRPAARRCMRAGAWSRHRVCTGSQSAGERRARVWKG